MCEQNIERLPEVQLETGKLEQEAEALVTTVERLAARLSALLRPEPAKDTAEEPQHNAPYAKRLQLIRVSFERQRLLLRDLLEVLEF